MHAYLYLTLGDPMDCGPPGSSVHEVFPARVLEWVAIFPPGHLPKPGVEPTSPVSPALQADSLNLKKKKKKRLVSLLL